jgi:hypothetical protein
MNSLLLVSLALCVPDSYKAMELVATLQMSGMVAAYWIDVQLVVQLAVIICCILSAIVWWLHIELRCSELMLHIDVVMLVRVPLVVLDVCHWLLF